MNEFLYALLRFRVFRLLLAAVDWFNPQDLRAPGLDKFGWRIVFAWLPVQLVHFYDDGQGTDGDFTRVGWTWFTFVWRCDSWRDRTLHMALHPITGIAA